MEATAFRLDGWRRLVTRFPATWAVWRIALLGGLRSRAKALGSAPNRYYRVIAQPTLSHGYIALAVGVLVVSVVAVLLGWHHIAPPHAGAENSSGKGAPPAPPPMLLRPVDPLEAVAINSRIAFSRDANPPARAFRWHGDQSGYERALSCLTQAVYYEAATEPEAGQLAVAQVILNRVRHRTFPKTVCGVVYQGSTLPTGCQFTFTCDGSLDRPPSLGEWRRAEKAASKLLAGFVFAPVGYATHYHANFVVPYWNTSLAKNAVVGAHIFYRWPGRWGRAPAFQSANTGVEANPLMLRATALAARRQHGRLSRAALGKPDLDVGPNEAVELLSIVSLLADRSWRADPKNPYELAAQAHFSSFAEHTAVQIYRQFAAEDDQFEAAAVREMLLTKPGGEPLRITDFNVRGRFSKAGAGFGDALTDFAAVTSFEDFFKEQRPYYASVATPVHMAAVEVLRAHQEYTGLPSPPVKIVVAPLISRVARSDCTQVSRDYALLVHPSTADARNSEPKWPAALAVSALLRPMLIRETLSRAACPPSAGRCAARTHPLYAQMEAEIVRSFAARVSRTGAADEGTRPVLGSGPLSEAYTSYEANRRWFPTFADFYPVLFDIITDAQEGLPDNHEARRMRTNPSVRLVDLRVPAHEADPLVCIKL